MSGIYYDPGTDTFGGVNITGETVSATQAVGGVIESATGSQAKVDTHKGADVSASVHPNANTHITAAAPHTGHISHSLATAINDFLVASGAGTFIKKTLAETLTILGKGAASGIAPLDAASKVPTVNLGGSGAGGTNFLRGDQTWATPAGAPAANPWDGLISAAYSNGDPIRVLSNMQRASNISPTPTQITITVARIAYFKLPANLTVNKIRYFGVGATTNVYRVAIYNGDTLARLTAELPFTTEASAWGAAGSALGVTLTAGQLYFIAVAVNAVGTTPGVLAYGTTIAATTGMMAVLPKNWPGNLDVDLAAIPATAHAQFAVTAGALPATAGTIVIQSAWAGGMPAFFLDNSNL